MFEWSSIMSRFTVASYASELHGFAAVLVPVIKSSSSQQFILGTVPNWNNCDSGCALLCCRL